MAVLVKAVLTSAAAAAVALSMAACGSSTSSTASSAASAASSAASAVSSAASSAASVASSAASSAVSSASEAAGAAAAQGSLASVCTEIDTLMMGNPDADPAGTAKQLESIKEKITTPDADLVENLAAAYTAIAANPTDTDAQNKVSTSARALGAGCQSATGAPAHN